MLWGFPTKEHPHALIEDFLKPLLRLEYPSLNRTQNVMQDTLTIVPTIRVLYKVMRFRYYGV